MLRSPLRPAVLVTLLATAAAALPGCGDSPLRKASDAYRAQVDPLLAREDQVWQRNRQASMDLDGDLKAPRYFDYLSGTAAPFYADLRDQFAAVVPGHERLTAPHADLLLCADLRKEFVKREGERRALIADTRVAAVEEARIQAGMAETEYVEKLGGDLPDPRFTELSALRDEVLDRLLPALQEGSRDVADVAERNRKHTLPGLRALRDGRYEDDERSRALRKAVALAEESMRQVLDGLPATVPLARATQRVSAIATESEAIRRRALDALAAVAREK